jgi:hypothetical protein
VTDTKREAPASLEKRAAHRTDKRARARDPGGGLPCGPRPDTRRGEGEGRIGFTIARCPQVPCAAVVWWSGRAGGSRVNGGAALAAGGSIETAVGRGLRESGGRRWGGPGGAGAPERAREARMAWTARGSCTPER